MRQNVMVLIGALVTAAFAFSATAQAQAPKIAFVDLQKFAQQSQRYRAQQKKLIQLAQKKQAELEKKKEQLISRQEDLKKQGPMLKEDTRNARVKELGIMEMELKLSEKQAQNLLKSHQRESMASLQKEIRKIISGIRKQKKLALIFNSGALLGADDTLDITADLVKAYDVGAAAPVARKPASKPAAPRAKPRAPVKPKPKPKSKK